MEVCEASSSAASASQSRSPIAPTEAMTRTFSVTTWRARRRRTGSGSPSTVSSGTSRSDERPSASAAAVHSPRRSPYEPSVRVWLTRVSITRSTSPESWSGSSTGIALPSAKSSSSAWPGSASMAMVWSMPPVGAPTYSFSARTHAAANRRRSARSVRSSSSSPARAVATEHSRAAELDRPAPTGTSESIVASKPGTSWPSSRSTETTPATYAAQPSGRSSTVPSQTVSSWALDRLSARSVRGTSVTVVRWGSATGRQRPPL